MWGCWGSKGALREPRDDKCPRLPSPGLGGQEGGPTGAWGSEKLVLRPLRCWWSSQEPGGWIGNAPKSQQGSQEPPPEWLPQAQEKLGEESLPPPFLPLSSPLRMPDRRPGIRAARGPAQNRDQTRAGAGAVGQSLAQLFLGLWPRADAQSSVPLVSHL